MGLTFGIGAVRGKSAKTKTKSAATSKKTTTAKATAAKTPRKRVMKAAPAAAPTPTIVEVVTTAAPAAAAPRKRRKRTKKEEGMTSSQLTRYRAGKWKSFGTPLQATCTAAGNDWRNAATKKSRKTAAAKLATCNWLKGGNIFKPKLGKAVKTTKKYY